MIEIARLNAEDRADLFLLAASKLGVTPSVIEKDFWVCFVLGYLFQRSIYRERIVFKGGTSLSKCYRLIRRFSEDVDLILDWRELGYGLHEPWNERSNARQESFKQETVSRTIAFLREQLIPSLQRGLSEELGHEMSLRLAREEETVLLEYPRRFENSGQLDNIRLEIGPLAAWTPSENAAIQPYLTQAIPGLTANPSAIVKTVKPERTFWEKATILHQEAHRPENKPMPPRYSRHYYDIWQMAISPVKDKALGEPALLERVVLFKEKFYRTPWARLSGAKPGTLRLVPPAFRLPELRKDYEAMKEMLFGQIPDFQEIVDDLKQLENEINERTRR